MTATYAQSRQELIQAITPHAQAFAELVRNRHLQSYSQGHTNIKRYHPKKMDFGYLADNFPVHHAEFTTSEIPGGQEGIKIWFNPWCFIAYYNIRERTGQQVQVTRSPAQLINSVPKGAQRVNLDNPTPSEQNLSKEFEAVTGKGGSRDIGAKASASFRQMIAAGGEAASFKSETEITTAVETSANMNKWYSETLADKTTWAGLVPPQTRYVLSRLVEVGRYRQQVTVDGALDCSVYILSRGDFDVKFDSFDDLAAVLSGVGNTGKGGHYSDWAKAYSVWRLGPELDWWLGRICGNLNARYVDFDESDQATDENISWEAESLAG